MCVCVLYVCCVHVCMCSVHVHVAAYVAASVDVYSYVWKVTVHLICCSSRDGYLVF